MYNLTKQLLFILIFLKSGVASGQEFSYPLIKNEGQTISDFVPGGWIIKDSASGDLNNDQKDDYVIVLEHKDSATILKKEDNIVREVITNPRILVILFQEKNADKFRLAAQNNTFILNEDYSIMNDDPYQSIKIKNGVLHIDFTILYGPGSYDMLSYSFRYQNKEFALIGANTNYYNMATSDTRICSYNFLTKKWSKIQGNDNDGKRKLKEIWHTLNLKELKTLKTFKEPNTWQVTKENYL
jgi:hypothetical protein